MYIRTCSFKYHSYRNNHTTCNLLAGSTSWPFRIMPQVWLSSCGNQGRLRSYPPAHIHC